MMHRHLLTLFALFTGLAALQAPAQAAAPQTMVAGAEALARTGHASQRENTGHAAVAETMGLQRSAMTQPLFGIAPQAPLSAPVLLRVDRALE